MNPLVIGGGLLLSILSVTACYWIILRPRGYRLFHGKSPRDALREAIQLAEDAKRECQKKN